MDLRHADRLQPTCIHYSLSNYRAGCPGIPDSVIFNYSPVRNIGYGWSLKE